MSVAAVVVTFNRLELLKNCIAALRKQTFKLDEIIVVNNGSTDNTLEWLNEQADITVITQGNTGSAGGQHTGIKTAFDKEHEWIWLMDDDGYPSENALEKLFEYRKGKKTSELCVLNSLVIDPENPEKLAFSLTLDKGTVLYTIREVNNFKLEIEKGSFFNGTLLHREIVRTVGLPDLKYFIRGEERDYHYRIKERHKIYTVRSSIFYHPAPKANYKKIGKMLIEYDENLFKTYYSIRNNLWLLKKYDKNIIHPINFTLKSLIKMMIGTSKKRRILVILNAIKNGWYEKDVKYEDLLRN